jgi:hypothetical protein
LSVVHGYKSLPLNLQTKDVCERHSLEVNCAHSSTTQLEPETMQGTLKTNQSIKNKKN